MMSKIMTGAFVCFVMFIICYQEVSARPKNPPNNMQICDILYVDICQKCAKLTKSPLVYPLCCNDEDGVYSWCEKYVNYGLH